MILIILLALSTQQTAHQSRLFPVDPRLPQSGAVIGKVVKINDDGKFQIQIPDKKGEIPNLKQRSYTFAFQDAEIAKDPKLRKQAVQLLRKHYRLDYVRVYATKATPNFAFISAAREREIPKGMDPSPEAQLVLVGLAKRRSPSNIPKEFEAQAKKKHLGIWKT